MSGTTERPRVKLVAFDLGRVLIRLCDGWGHACQITGISPKGGLREPTDTEARAFDEIASRYDTGIIDAEQFSREVAPLRGFEPSEIMRLIDVILQGPYPGVEALIDDLHAAGVATSCLSNTCEPHWSMMLNPGGEHSLPLHRLTHRFASHLVGLRKPDKRIYEHVEATTGATGQQILFFDDLAANVDAATAHGWQAHRIMSKEDPVAEARSVLRVAGVI